MFFDVFIFIINIISEIQQHLQIFGDLQKIGDKIGDLQNIGDLQFLISPKI